MKNEALFAGRVARLSGEQAFCHYEVVRDLLPTAPVGTQMQGAGGLLEIADHFDVFVFDAYGVLNVGNTAIAGSNEVISELRAMGKRVYVLSNGASYSAADSVAKLEKFGFDFSAAEIVSSRMATERAFAAMNDGKIWGVMAKPDYSPDEFAMPNVKLTREGAGFEEAQGFLLLSTLDWDEGQQKLLDDSLANRLRPIIVANPDIVSPREDHFGMEPGYIGHRLMRKFGVEAKFYGKPFPSVFEIVEERFAEKVSRSRICMIGDTLHTDILGGAAYGWQTVLVTNHGMFKGLDAHEYVARSGIVPNWIVPSI